MTLSSLFWDVEVDVEPFSASTPIKFLPVRRVLNLNEGGEGRLARARPSIDAAVLVCCDELGAEIVRVVPVSFRLVRPKQKGPAFLGSWFTGRGATSTVAPVPCCHLEATTVMACLMPASVAAATASADGAGTVVASWVARARGR